MVKKAYIYLTILLSFFIFNINVFAIPNEVILGGQNIGIDIKYDGVMVVGFYKIKGKYNKNNLQIGDIIKKVDDTEINTIDDLLNNINSNNVNLTIKRDEKELSIPFILITDNKTYKTGLYVKDSISGIGTLTYIDPISFIYGALGHEIIESKTNTHVEVRNGSIYKTKVTSIDKSRNGDPGGKNAEVVKNNVYGNIKKNTKSGIYGTFNDLREYKDTIEVGKSKEIIIGKAKLRTVLNDTEILEYNIDITKIDYNHNTKNIYFEIIDESLINKTGGVVQGMSGSPIIQNNKLVGAVTHVVVDNPKKGYGIFIESMLEEGEK